MLVFALMLAATPLVADQGPQVVRTLERDEDRLVLELDPAFDADEVAGHVRRRLPESQVLVDGHLLFVEGPTVDGLRRALAGIEIEATPNDLDALLASLRVPGSDEEGSGSSVRARRETTDPVGAASAAERAQAPGTAVTARVIGLERQRFPLVLVRVRLNQAPEGTDLDAGEQITVVPRVHSHRGLVDPDDAASQRNVGAWYAKPGDPVRLVLEPHPDGLEVWVASRFERAEPTPTGAEPSPASGPPRR